MPRAAFAVAVNAVPARFGVEVKAELPVADGDEPRVTPAPTDTSARLARSEGAVKALSGQLSCAPALPVAARPEAVSGHAGLLAPPGTGPRGAVQRCLEVEEHFGVRLREARAAAWGSRSARPGRAADWGRRGSGPERRPWAAT